MLSDRRIGYACAALIFVIALLGSARDAVAGITQGSSCSTPGAVAPIFNSANDDGNNLVCISGTWQYPSYALKSAAASAGSSCSGYPAGALRYNTTLGTVEFCSGGGTWSTLDAGNIYLGTTTTAANPQRSGDATTGLLSLTTSTVSIETAGVEALRVTATQSIGIGTTTPATPLEVDGNGGANPNGTLYVNDNSNSSAAPVIRIRGNRNDGNTSQSFSGGIYLEHNYTAGAIATNMTLGTIYFGGNYDTTPDMTYSSSISSVADGAWSTTTSAPAALTFYTGSTGNPLYTANTTFGTERMRITSGGGVGIGTASPQSKLDVSGGVAIGASFAGTTGAPTNGAIVQGKVGIANSSPAATLDINGAAKIGTDSAVCGVSIPGELQWTGSALQYCNGTSWQNIGSVSGGIGSALSAITAAVSTNNIDNAAFAQTWTWNTLTTQNALTLSSTSETTGSLLVISNSDTSGAGKVLNVTTASSTGTAGSFTNTATSGANFGITVVADSTSGIAGNFTAVATSGVTYGVHVGNASTTDLAIAGRFEETGATGGTMGVFAESDSTGTGFGVQGVESGAGNSGYGGYFYNTATSGTNYGIYATDASTSGDAGLFVASATSGTTYAVDTSNASTSGVGVRGYDNATTGSTIGVVGRVDSTSGEAGFFNATATSGTSYGVYAQNASTGAGTAVYAAQNGSGNTGYAVYALNNSASGWGVYAAGTSPSYFGGFVEWVGQSRVSSTFTKTSDTSLAAIPGLSATLGAGNTYYFDITLYTTSGNSGGIQADLSGGSATATSIIGDAISLDGGAIKTQTRIAALSTGLCSVKAVTAANCHITGTITVNAGGSFIPRFAQNSSNGTASTVAIGSIMLVQQVQ